LRTRNLTAFAAGLLALFCGLFWAAASPAENPFGPEKHKARQALTAAMAELGVKKGETPFLVLTNAGYGQLGGRTTEAFLDLAADTTGRTMGTQSLLPVHTSVDEPLWFSLYRPDTHRLVFITSQGPDFKTQFIDAHPDKLFTPEGWKTAAAGLIGNKRLFSVASISLTWSAKPAWPLLLAATFHDHFCPGLNSGYIAAEYLKKKLPLQKGEKYVFVAAPSKCAADAVQVIFNATAGKEGTYGMSIGKQDWGKYFGQGTSPALIAMRVNQGSDTCEGVVLGMNWKQAYEDTGVKAEEHAPKDGPQNPLFWTSRVKMSKRLASMPLEKQMAYLEEVKRFSGKAGLAHQVAAGNPYQVPWQK
jgi:formylmethanofuran dehydrogenase subunit E-like metal-binding protein